MELLAWCTFSSVWVLGEDLALAGFVDEALADLDFALAFAAPCEERAEFKQSVRYDTTSTLEN